MRFMNNLFKGNSDTFDWPVPFFKSFDYLFKKVKSLVKISNSRKHL